MDIQNIFYKQLEKHNRKKKKKKKTNNATGTKDKEKCHISRTRQVQHKSSITYSKKIQGVIT